MQEQVTKSCETMNAGSCPSSYFRLPFIFYWMAVFIYFLFEGDGEDQNLDDSAEQEKLKKAKRRRSSVDDARLQVKLRRKHWNITKKTLTAWLLVLLKDVDLENRKLGVVFWLEWFALVFKIYVGKCVKSHARDFSSNHVV